MTAPCPSCGAAVQRVGRVLFDLDPTSGRLTHTCPTCDYAGCHLTSVRHEDGWAFCQQHYREHRADLYGERWPDLHRRGFPGWLFVPQHGTEAAYKRHLRAGESACTSCLQANQRVKQDRRRPRLKDTA